jgi:hypothetical protein
MGLHRSSREEAMSTAVAASGASVADRDSSEAASPWRSLFQVAGAPLNAMPIPLQTVAAVVWPLPADRVGEPRGSTKGRSSHE